MDDASLLELEDDWFAGIQPFPIHSDGKRGCTAPRQDGSGLGIASSQLPCGSARGPRTTTRDEEPCASQGRNHCQTPSFCTSQDRLLNLLNSSQAGPASSKRRSEFPIPASKKQHQSTAENNIQRPGWHLERRAQHPPAVPSTTNSAPDRHKSSGGEAPDGREQHRGTEAFQGEALPRRMPPERPRPVGTDSQEPGSFGPADSRVSLQHLLSSASQLTFTRATGHGCTCLLLPIECI